MLEKVFSQLSKLKARKMLFSCSLTVHYFLHFRMNSSYGNITWWGFSPALDLLDLMNKREAELDEKNINVLLVGSGDGRHIIQTLLSFCKAESTSKTINFYIQEYCFETMARQMLLLNLLLQSADDDLGVHEKMEMFLEIYGNSLIRNDTDMYLSKQCDEFVKIITDPSYAKESYPLFDFSNLKYKELDKLERIFKFWCNKESVDFDISTQWDYRLRQYLGVRYDARENAFDWDYSMHLKEKASIVNWQEYKHWRETGVAFRIRDETAYEVANRTLASGLVFKKDGERIPRRGFWGDILISPYITFGTTSHNKSLLEKNNGVHVKTATDVACENISLISKVLAASQRGVRVSEIHSVTETENSSVLNNVKVVFLPLESVSKMHNKSKYVEKFDLIFFSNSTVHLLDNTIQLLFRSSGSLLVIESSKYMLQLKPELHKQYSEKIEKMCGNINCEIDKTFLAEKHDYAVFKFQGS